MCAGFAVSNLFLTGSRLRFASRGCILDSMTRLGDRVASKTAQPPKPQVTVPRGLPNPKPENPPNLEPP